MSKYINPWPQYLDENGNPYAGGTVFFGEQNQDPISNPKPPFSDKALQVPIGASQVLDDKGMLQTSIYLKGLYSASLFDIDNNFIRTDPDITGTAQSAGVLFSSVADMKAGLTIDGDTVEVSEGQTLTTQGYYVAGDGGGATYLVESGTTPDTFIDHNVTGGNHATLQRREWVYAPQIGLTSSNVGDIGAELKAKPTDDGGGRNAKLEMPVGSFTTDKTMTVDLRGVNQALGFTNSNTTIVGTDLTIPVFQFQHHSQTLQNINFEYDVSGLGGVFVPTMQAIATTDFNVSVITNHGAKIKRVGIRNSYYGMWLSQSIFGSSIDQVEIGNCYVGVFTPPNSNFQTSLAIGMIKTVNCVRSMDITSWVYCSFGLYADKCGLTAASAELVIPATMTPVVLTTKDCKGIQITTFGLERTNAMLFNGNGHSYVNVSSLHYDNVAADLFIRDAARTADVPFAEQAFIRLQSSHLSISSTEMILRTTSPQFFPDPSTTDTDFVYHVSGTDNSRLAFKNSLVDIGCYYWSRQTGGAKQVVDFDAFTGRITDRFLDVVGAQPKGKYLTKNLVEQYTNVYNTLIEASKTNREGDNFFRMYEKFSGTTTKIHIPFTAFNEGNHSYYVEIRGYNNGAANSGHYRLTISGRYGVSNLVVESTSDARRMTASAVGDVLTITRDSGFDFDSINVEIMVMSDVPYFITDSGGDQKTGFDLREQFLIEVDNITST